MNLKKFLSSLLSDYRLSSEIVHRKVLVGRSARFKRLDPALPELLSKALSNDGIKNLYLHQAEGIHLARQGSHVVTVTPTASGKTLVYILPILERILIDPDTRALLLFPLKALAQDQLKKLMELGQRLGLPASSIAIYDGDTSANSRVRIRQNPPNLLLTNPDMIHQSLLPFHSQWEKLFRQLRYVVVDELHSYKGVFGSHVLQILRRLRRVALFYQAKPQFLATSATIANPKQLAEQLTGLPFALVQENGAPSATRHIFFINPKASLYTIATRLFVEAIISGQKTIVFTKARKITELIHRWTVQSNPGLESKISAYRAGYLPSERREIEQKLQSGVLDGVISTSALEMGIDIGGLDVCILVGYPGTITATWQRAGRVGRKDRDSAILFIAQPDALDQYFMRYPQDFFSRGAEAGVVDEGNPHILKNHLVCAAQEVPLRSDDQVYEMKNYDNIIKELVQARALTEAADGTVWFSNRRQPQREMDIRGAGQSYTIMEKGGQRLIGHVSGLQALTECHPEAVYLHAGQTYVVKDLDLGKAEVRVLLAQVSYYTAARTEKETEILEVFESRKKKEYSAGLGRLKVTERVIGYEKRSTATREKISEHKIDLPPVIYETVGLWIELSASTMAGLINKNHHAMGSIHAIEHASLALVPLFALCDRNDLGGISFTGHPQLNSAAIFLYDGHPGGVGLSVKTYQVLDELLAKVLGLIEGCSCQDGCPSCIHSPKCGNGNVPLDKQGCLRLLKHINGEEELVGQPYRNNNLFHQEKEKEMKPSDDQKQNEKSEWYTSRLSLTERRDIVVFDLETQLSSDDVGGWHNAHLMRMSVGVIYERITGQYRTYREDKVGELLQRLREAELVVGFNQKRFDYNVLHAYTGNSLTEIASLDLLEEIYKKYGFRLSLGNLASATLGVPKTADGLTALRWWKEGKIEKIEEYCRMDVELTARLFDYVLEYGYLIYEHKYQGRVKLPLELNL